MSNYRQLHSRMWSSDNWFVDLKPELKLLFIYLFSNERASICGLYELPLRIISFETGLDTEAVKHGLGVFENADKIKYDYQTGVIWVKNMLKYQGSSSPKVQTRIAADIKIVPDCGLKQEFISSHPDMVSVLYADGKDTSYSYSYSVSSESQSESLEGEGVGEETNWIPETPAQAMNHPDIQAYKAVCGRMPGSRDYQTIIETIRYLRDKHPHDLDAYLKPYWIAWSTRKTKNGSPYQASSLVWLCEWAMQEEIPRVNGHEPKLGERSSVDDVIQKVVSDAKQKR